eukprot:12973640-Heterocapsa_arctica.AAC.1
MGGSTDGSSGEQPGLQFPIRKRGQGSQRGNFPRQGKGSHHDGTAQSGRLAVPVMWAHGVGKKGQVPEMRGRQSGRQL